MISIPPFLTMAPRTGEPARQDVRLSARPTLEAIARLLTQPPAAPPAWASSPLHSLMAPPVAPTPMGADTIPAPAPKLTVGPVRRISGLLAAVVLSALREREE